jgi:hypothetical protein
MASNKKVYRAGVILKPVEKRVGKWSKEPMPHLLLLESREVETEYTLWDCLQLDTGLRLEYGEPTLQFYYQLHE